MKPEARLQPLSRWLRQRLTPEAETSAAGWATAVKLQHALLADSPDEVRDIFTAMVLSECIYKARPRWQPCERPSRPPQRPATEVVLRAGEFKARGWPHQHFPSSTRPFAVTSRRLRLTPAQAEFPPGLVVARNVQLSSDDAPHRRGQPAAPPAAPLTQLQVPPRGGPRRPLRRLHRHQAAA